MFATKESERTGGDPLTLPRRRIRSRRRRNRAPAQNAAPHFLVAPPPPPPPPRAFLRDGASGRWPYARPVMAARHKRKIECYGNQRTRIAAVAYLGDFVATAGQGRHGCHCRGSVQVLNFYFFTFVFQHSSARDLQKSYSIQGVPDVFDKRNTFRSIYNFSTFFFQ